MAPMTRLVVFEDVPHGWQFQSVVNYDGSYEQLDWAINHNAEYLIVDRDDSLFLKLFDVFFGADRIRIWVERNPDNGPYWYPTHYRCFYKAQGMLFQQQPQGTQPQGY